MRPAARIKLSCPWCTVLTGSLVVRLQMRQKLASQVWHAIEAFPCIVLPSYAQNHLSGLQKVYDLLSVPCGVAVGATKENKKDRTIIIDYTSETPRPHVAPCT